MNSQASSFRTQLLTTRDEVRRYVLAERRDGRTVGLVPTMGALHSGHLSLVKASCAECDKTVVSIFVNPTQFGAGEDFDAYPRDLDSDLAELAAVGADLVFAPSTDEMYPGGCTTRIEPGSVARTLEGRCRPGHFAGVATVVLKLFHAVPADMAYFGQKDYQQVMVIRRMTDDLDVPIQIRVCPTVRDDDGLALSSRNAYLGAAQRQQALSLVGSLRLAEQLIVDGERDAATIIRQMRTAIDAGGDVRIDYVALAQPETLEPVRRVEGPVVALVAVRIGAARLIDNAVIDPVKIDATGD